ncbi:hypothetical protein MYCTH_2304023 [Thermothelomyces thermophilus ATCC 42464]|uniref:Uncharacterized protein n=1 Tax=Thermothelomyces thermophilus (strain ATCC 42464 / BCRC 31852 / DSM 1799) TaxID=573729 RepID=G2QE54_THET4|nr:uncharacterized protein MYCTH_2304023 [Thermothelomyces thermophilus ATCC 42464]AEO57637.1 hypothetical protein MYCTH_2304023 [Thermothelomyces thermophilus ATCC 42464]
MVMAPTRNRRLARPAIATLSRKWQFAVEPLVFRAVRIKSIELDESSRPSSRHPIPATPPKLVEEPRVGRCCAPGA